MHAAMDSPPDGRDDHASRGGSKHMAGTGQFGIYRGMVLSVTDPAGRSRVQVLVPGVGGQTSGWADPCLPAGSSASPKVGDTVWVMFEAGDTSHPVYMGFMPK